MKHNRLISAALVVLLGCADGESGSATAKDSLENNPSAIDTTQHPNGVTTGSVISTDTAAMKVDSFVKQKK